MDIREFSDLCKFIDLPEIDRAVHLIYFKVHLKKEGEVTVSEIANSLADIDFPRPNVSRLNDRLRKDARTISKGNGRFQLHKRTIVEFERIFDSQTPSSSLKPVALSLQEISNQIIDEKVKSFVDEAIGCINGNHYRAAIVLSWQGAIFMLQKHVFDSYKSEISKELLSRGFIKKPINKVEDFQRIKESEFLIGAECCGAISKSAKSVLEEALNRRNRAGHPNDLTFSDISVASHLEDLIRIVYGKNL